MIFRRAHKNPLRRNMYWMQHRKGRMQAAGCKRGRKRWHFGSGSVWPAFFKIGVGETSDWLRTLRLVFASCRYVWNKCGRSNNKAVYAILCVSIPSSAGKRAHKNKGNTRVVAS